MTEISSYINVVIVILSENIPGVEYSQFDWSDLYNFEMKMHGIGGRFE